MAHRVVAGESAELLMEALGRIEWKPTPDGMMQADVYLEPRLGEPLIRAVQRVQAELLLQDANRREEPGHRERTHAQRAADAFVALALRVADTVNEAF